LNQAEKWSDEALLAMLRDATTFERGFNALCMQYEEKIYMAIRRIIVDHDEANDVYQNTMINIFKGIIKFEGKSSLYTWMYRIATNESLTHVRKNKQKQVYSLDGHHTEDGGVSVAMYLEADPYFDGDAAQARLMEAMQQLPERQREVFRMRYFDELSYKDIAEILQLTEGALKATFHHAVKKIEMYIKEEKPLQNKE
jgi:RNA polymerase sigma-70 factor (ECF subfamily)